MGVCNRIVFYGLLLCMTFVGLYLFLHYVRQAERSGYHVYQEGFGEWSISRELFDYIRKIVPDGKVILEFGSGWASEQLSRYYTVYSIEHDKVWLDRYDTHYIYAPIKDGWYDVKALQEKLPKAYDLILVDGPTKAIGRYGFYENLSLFNTNIPIIFDDVHRSAEYKLMVDVAKKLERTFVVFETEDNKTFGVIMSQAV
jgi:hypothetical protein